MPDIAIYYPYTHVRDEGWLKAAALYWPKLAVIALSAHPAHLSRTARVLRDELGFFVDVEPHYQAEDVGTEFISFADRHGAGLRRRYAYLRDLPPSELAAGPPDTAGSWHMYGDRYDVGGVGWVNLFKLSPQLAGVLVERGIGRLSKDGLWVGMHPRLADVYVAALADRLARANQMAAITDQPRMYGTLNGWNMETLAQVLLSDDTDARLPRHETEEVAALYAAAAISTVVPRGLGGVPAERIVQARRALANEFDAFRAHLDSLTEQFSEMAQIESPEILQARLELLVERDLRRPTADLKRGLRRLGLEPARAVLGLKSLELPAVAATAVTGIGVPVAVGQAGLVAAQMVASSVHAHHVAQQQRLSAAGYLLGLRKELNPRGVMGLLRAAFRRGSLGRMV
jgi:uncharacterized protein DUF6236